jgi:hypothetical protein
MLYPIGRVRSEALGRQRVIPIADGPGLLAVSVLLCLDRADSPAAFLLIGTFRRSANLLLYLESPWRGFACRGGDRQVAQGGHKRRTSRDDGLNHRHRRRVAARHADQQAHPVGNAQAVCDFDPAGVRRLRLAFVPVACHGGKWGAIAVIFGFHPAAIRWESAPARLAVHEAIGQAARAGVASG